MTCLYLEGNTDDVTQASGAGFVLFICIPFPLGARYLELAGQLLTCTFDSSKLTGIDSIFYICR